LDFSSNQAARFLWSVIKGQGQTTDFGFVDDLLDTFDVSYFFIFSTH
jgi:hypothetical protein